MFKRRTPRSYARILWEVVYPRGGWRRAARYVAYRLRRLPDPAHKISRGIGAGVFASFTPLYGFHFVLSAIFAFVIRGNMLAAMLATFAGNPLTFPLIASVSMQLGTWMLGRPSVPVPRVWRAFAQASTELWHNMQAIFTPDVMRWARLGDFMNEIFLPYLIGGLIPGLICGALAAWLAHPAISAYQTRRISKLKAKYEKRVAKEAARAEKAALRAERAEAKAAALVERLGGRTDPAE